MLPFLPRSRNFVCLGFGNAYPASSWVFSFREALSTRVSLLVASGGAAIPNGWELPFGEAAKGRLLLSAPHYKGFVLAESAIYWRKRLLATMERSSSAEASTRLGGVSSKSILSLGQNDLDRSPRYFFDSQKRILKKLPCSVEPYPSESGAEKRQVPL